jgi:hypothetical protein
MSPTEENATHNTFAKLTWIFSASISRFALQIYCGLHIFNSAGLIITREVLCISHPNILLVFRQQDLSLLSSSVVSF